MDRQQKQQLEPKYTGNQRKLTDGEAANIMHDPANEVHETDDDEIIAAPPVTLPNAGGIDRIQP